MNRNMKACCCSMAGRILKKGKRGFSLTEMLCTVLIMSIVATSAVTGMVSLANSYKRILMTSNAEELCNVLTTTMTGELGYAKYVEVGSNDKVSSFYSVQHQLCMYDINDKGRLVAKRKTKGPGGTVIDDNSDPLNAELEVIASKTYTDGLKIDKNNWDIKCKKNGNSYYFTVHLSIVDSKGNEITKTDFAVKGLNADIV